MRPLLAFGLLAACATAPPPAVRRARAPRAPRPAAANTARGAPATTFHTPAAPLPAAVAAPPARPAVQPMSNNDPRCLGVLRHNEALIARASAEAGCAGGAVAALRESFGGCAWGPDGGWVAEVTDLRADDDGGICHAEVRWRPMLVHRGGGVVEENGEPGRVARTFRVVASGDEVQAYTRLSLTSSDLDGDRLPEVTVVATTIDHGVNRHDVDVEVYTASGQRVAPFEPTRAMRLLDVVDADDDGRADFLIPAPYTWSEGAECGHTVIREPLSLLAHSLPQGGFSTTDAVAARYLRAVCPGPDADPVPPRTGDGVDPAGVGVICRRLWGATPEEALAPLQCASFRAEPSPRCGQTTQALPPLSPGECPAHYDVWARSAPPLRLR